MTNICIISDTHNTGRYLDKIMPILNECDRIIHLGDGICDIIKLEKLFPDKLINTYGNCDSHFSNSYEIIDIEGVRILYTHGHKLYVKQGLDMLITCAENEKANFAFYGHTHIPFKKTFNGITYICPGSLGYNGTYCYMSIHNGKGFIKPVQLF